MAEVEVFLQHSGQTHVKGSNNIYKGFRGREDLSRTNRQVQGVLDLADGCRSYDALWENMARRVDDFDQGYDLLILVEIMLLGLRD